MDMRFAAEVGPTSTLVEFPLAALMLTCRTSSGVGDSAVAVFGVPLLVRVNCDHCNSSVPVAGEVVTTPQTFCEVASELSQGEPGVVGGHGFGT